MLDAQGYAADVRLLDLREAQLAPDAHLDVRAVLGGIVVGAKPAE